MSESRISSAPSSASHPLAPIEEAATGPSNRLKPAAAPALAHDNHVEDAGALSRHQCGEDGLLGNALREGLARAVSAIPRGGYATAEFDVVAGEGVQGRVTAEAKLERLEDGRVKAELTVGANGGVGANARFGAALEKKGIEAGGEAAAGVGGEVGAVLVFGSEFEAVHGLAGRAQELALSGVQKQVGRAVGLVDHGSGRFSRLGGLESAHGQLVLEGRGQLEAALGPIGARLGLEVTGSPGLSFNAETGELVAFQKLDTKAEGGLSGLAELPGGKGAALGQGEGAELKSLASVELRRQLGLELRYQVDRAQLEKGGVRQALAKALQQPPKVVLVDTFEIHTPRATEVGTRQLEVSTPAAAAHFLNPLAARYEVESFQTSTSQTELGMGVASAELKTTVASPLGKSKEVSAPGMYRLAAEHSLAGPGFGAELAAQAALYRAAQR